MKQPRNRHTGRVNSATKSLIHHALPEHLVLSDRSYYVAPMGYVKTKMPDGEVLTATKCQLVRVRATPMLGAV